MFSYSKKLANFESFLFKTFLSSTNPGNTINIKLRLAPGQNSNRYTKINTISDMQNTHIPIHIEQAIYIYSNKGKYR